MRATRGLVIVLFASLLVAAAIVDRFDRPVDGLVAPVRSALTTAASDVVTWYCTGGSGSDGPAVASLELVNTGVDDGHAIVSVLPGGRIAVDGSTVEVTVLPGEREAVALADLVPGAQWAAAVVEVDRSDLVVEQLVSGPSGTDESPCTTRTADRWVVPSGATRLVAEGERHLILLLNPFPDDAVVDLAFSADVGLDDREGVVVPAGEVAAVDVTEEVKVAARVATVVDVVAGRVAVGRIQIVAGPTAGRGLRAAVATPDGAALWYLPVVARVPGRSDVVSVTNPSGSSVAEVDIEVITDDPDRVIDPIELSVRPGRTVTVQLATEDRLAGVEAMSLVVRSLDGVPVAAALDTVVVGDPELGTNLTEGASGMAGADAAATDWVVAMNVVPDDAESMLVIVNPSAVAIATVALAVDGDEIRTLELGPGRRAAVPVAEIAEESFVVEVSSSSPVVVGRELAGFTSRSAALGVARSAPVAFADLP